MKPELEKAFAAYMTAAEALHKNEWKELVDLLRESINPLNRRTIGTSTEPDAPLPAMAVGLGHGRAGDRTRFYKDPVLGWVDKCGIFPRFALNPPETGTNDGQSPVSCPSNVRSVAIQTSDPGQTPMFDACQQTLSEIQERLRNLGLGIHTIKTYFDDGDTSRAPPPDDDRR